MCLFLSCTYFCHQLSDGIQAMADTGEVKLVLVVNNELRMGKGKIAAQVAYSLLGALIMNQLNIYYASPEVKNVIKLLP